MSKSSKASPAAEPEKKTSEPATEPTYDVAISFLVADEKIASAIRSKLSGLNVFFYPHNQEELIGSNGLESMRAPFLSSRVNVVLFRSRYGHTPWTAVELAAIQDSCLRTGFRSLVFVQLDKDDPKPDWLPDTHIRCVLGDFTVDQLVGAIKSKVQERGGMIQRPDAMSEARRVKQEAEYLAAREAMMQDRAWIEGTVHRSLVEAFRQVEQLVGKLNDEEGYQIRCGAEGYRACVMRSDYVSLGCGWRQPIFNQVGDSPHGDCFLRVAEFSGPLLLPRENAVLMHDPRQLKEHKIKVGVSENRELVWLAGGQQIAPEKLAEHIVMLLLDLISRANRGKVPRPDM
jgi:hypothetical protein